MLLFQCHKSCMNQVLISRLLLSPFIPFLLLKRSSSSLSLFAVDDINGCWWDRWLVFYTLISSYISLFLSSSVPSVFSLLFSFTRRKTRFLRPLNIDQENKKTGKLVVQLYQEKRWERNWYHCQSLCQSASFSFYRDSESCSHKSEGMRNREVLRSLEES